MVTPTPAQRRTPHHPTATIRDHLTALLNAGMTRKHITATTGIGAATLYEILHLTRPKVKHHTATQILALRPQPASAAGQVPALGTIRRLQALTAYGYPLRRLAALTGVAASGIRALLRSERRWVHSNTQRRVAATYERLSITPGPSEVARRTGRGNGWAVPAAWDDIDNPESRPAGAPELRPDVRRVRGVLDGRVPFAALTAVEHPLLYVAWSEQEQRQGRRGGGKPFARAHGLTEWQGRQIARQAQNTNTSRAADSRTNRKVA